MKVYWWSFLYYRALCMELHAKHDWTMNVLLHLVFIFLEIGVTEGHWTVGKYIFGNLIFTFLQFVNVSWKSAYRLWKSYLKLNKYTSRLIVQYNLTSLVCPNLYIANIRFGLKLWHSSKCSFFSFCFAHIDSLQLKEILSIIWVS